MRRLDYVVWLDVYDDITIIQYGRIASTVRSICNQMQDVYTEAEIKELYNKLYPYT